ncbi:FHA domain-containing protein [Nostoc flagelliforme FACHB-838]|uniref:FHA domain-containing protein n=1 Tax=Nostoc flagelliforme FACHB-838 TaxID=2692904 RepID=A0ABR8DVG4_9NOSO|nr:FHA domain-containing protein [Nostoc flagelliforme]MBD2532871.1 FHA domain-containing protein [Nostoc flagelliforme FACHB-838]
MTTLIAQWKLTLQYEDAGKQQTWQFSQQQPTKNPDTIRIGRDNLRCDIVLQDNTVSSLHVEIFFDQLQNRFFIRNLRGLQNLPVVDGIPLYPDKEFSLYNNSIICLGKQKLKVTDISISGVSNLDATNLDYSPKPDKEGSSGKGTNNKNKFWKEPTGIATIITSVFTLGGVIITSVFAFSGVMISQYTEGEKIKFEQHKTQYQVQAEQNKLAQELLSKKQERAEERFYKHKAEILKMEKEKENTSKQIALTNSCNKTINIAVNLTALNDIEQTRGWNVISPGETIKNSYFIRSGTIFLYAETTDKKYEWKGKHLRQKYTIESPFDYIADDLTILISGDQERKSKNFQMKEFYGVNFNQSGVTTKRFSCNGDSLELS